MRLSVIEGTLGGFDFFPVGYSGQESNRGGQDGIPASSQLDHPNSL